MCCLNKTVETFRAMASSVCRQRALNVGKRSFGSKSLDLLSLYTEMGNMT
jgi:hypothetical protein